jgi:hypothetical protein
MKIRLVRAELFHADGRTDRTKLIVVFRIFQTRLKISKQRSRHQNLVTAEFQKLRHIASHFVCSYL